MRIARFSSQGTSAYGVVELAGDQGSHPDTIAVLAGDPFAGETGLTGQIVPLAEVRLLAPCVPPTKVACIGKNYADHVAEMGGTTPPPEPIVFFKPVNSVIAAGDEIVRPPETAMLHYEGELVIVFNRTCRRVPADRAAEVIFGYTIANDVTARDLQAKDGQWSRAKGFDSFCPLGPWIVTGLDLAQASDLGLRTLVNGEIRQDSRTSLMLHGIAALVAHVTAFTTMMAGDILLTGTPAGIGEIRAGDSVSIDIEGIGQLTNPVVAETIG